MHRRSHRVAVVLLLRCRGAFPQSHAPPTSPRSRRGPGGVQRPEVQAGRPRSRPAGSRASRACRGTPLIYYAATASGGVWSREEGGLDWSRSSQPGRCVDRRPSPSPPQPGGRRLCRCRRGQHPGERRRGARHLQIDDGGKTWSRVFKHGGRRSNDVVHPQNPDIAFAAVLARLRPIPTRRLPHRRRRQTWRQVLKKDANTGALDVCMDSSNPNVPVRRSVGRQRRRSWEMTSGGPGAACTSRATAVTPGSSSPEHGAAGGTWARSAAPWRPRRTARLRSDRGGQGRPVPLQRRGESWELASDHHALRQRAWYYTTLTVDPT